MIYFLEFLAVAIGTLAAGAVVGYALFRQDKNKPVIRHERTSNDL